jgi:hypothetical protein
LDILVVEETLEDILGQCLGLVRVGRLKLGEVHGYSDRNSADMRMNMELTRF